MLLPTINHDNFLSNDEITYIVNKVKVPDVRYDDIQNDKLTSYYYPWKFYSKEHKDLRDIFEPRIKDISGLDLVIDHCHILHSKQPYKLHTDYAQNKMFKKLKPAYTFIIPLETVNTNTVVFNQTSTIKDFDKYVAEEHPPTIPLADRISQEFIDTYLSHIQPSAFEYLTYREMFKWKKGSINMCDRQFFHTSDNYMKNGLSEKSAFIFWTSIEI